MDIKSFQKKLGEIVELARYNNRRLNGEMVERFFVDDGLDADQIKSVHEYLKSQGIRILNEEEEESEEEKPVLFELNGEAAPLTAEEEEYLSAYMTGTKDVENVSEEERRPLFGEVSEGREDAKQRLVELYLPEVIRVVRKLHRQDTFAGDMLQEGNLGILSALKTLESADDPHEWILQSIENAVSQSVRTLQEQKWEDNYLINRVEKLEAAVKDLTDGAEDKFSVEELSAFLDMSVEEIRDVLRLTGDDK